MKTSLDRKNMDKITAVVENEMDLIVDSIPNNTIKHKRREQMDKLISLGNINLPHEGIPPETTIEALYATRNEAIEKLKVMKNEHGLELSKLETVISVLDYEIICRRHAR